MGKVIENCKYTKDGNKVFIITRTSESTIVKRVFIKDGDEVVDGKEFIAVELFDSPNLTSWRDRRIGELERLSKIRHDTLDKEVKNINTKTGIAKSLLRSLERFTSDDSKKALDTFEGILNGDIKYVLSKSSLLITDLTESITYGSFSGLRLLSLFGNSNGDMTIGLNEYSDSSGRLLDVSFHKTHEDAELEAREIIIKYSKDTEENVESATLYKLKDVIDKCKKFGAKPSDKIKARYKELFTLKAKDLIRKNELSNKIHKESIEALKDI